MTAIVFACRHALFLRRTHAATVIQSAWRGHTHRERFLRLRKFIVNIQVHPSYYTFPHLHQFFNIYQVWGGKFVSVIVFENGAHSSVFTPYTISISQKCWMCSSLKTLLHVGHSLAFPVTPFWKPDSSFALGIAVNLNFTDSSLCSLPPVGCSGDSNSSLYAARLKRWCSRAICVAGSHDEG